jgi:DNA-directed RNA polymerase specialized sigma24 family protein
MPQGATSSSNSGGRIFTKTHWSIVLSAREKDSPDSAAARERLCSIYWPPLYHFLLREGYKPHDAQDLTQEFLSRFLHRDGLDHLRDQRGKFRSFLLTFLKHFLSDHRVYTNAQKRGGGLSWISLDACEAEERDALSPVDGLSADQIYDRRWAQAVMDEAARRLREEYAKRGKAELFDHLKGVQPGEHGEKNYAEIGAAFGLTEQAVKNAVLRFRRRYGDLVRDEIAQTVETPDKVDAEVRHLKQVFSG